MVPMEAKYDSLGAAVFTPDGELGLICGMYKEERMISLGPDGPYVVYWPHQLQVATREEAKSLEGLVAFYAEE